MGRAPRHPALREALAVRAALRADYAVVQEAAYDAAVSATSGNLVNQLGQSRGVSGWSLFSGPAVRAYLYASGELVEWWATHPRVTWLEYEAQALGPEQQHLGSHRWGEAVRRGA